MLVKAGVGRPPLRNISTGDYVNVKNANPIPKILTPTLFLT